MFALLKLILNFFSDEPKRPLTPKGGPTPSTKKIFLQLSPWDDELLSTPKIITFVAVSLSKIHNLHYQMLFHNHLYPRTFLCHYFLLH